MTVNVTTHNSAAWDGETELHNSWTIPVDRATVRRAQRGDWQLFLSPTRPIPRAWFPELAGLETLCLAAGGGQQGPILAAAGAKVTVFDNSPRQLERDRYVARRDGLGIQTVQGDMADLGMFADASFGLIAHPVSNVYAADVRPVWQEAFRVLRPGGVLIAAFDNPVRHIFDRDLSDRGRLKVRHKIPYSDLTSLTPQELQLLIDQTEPLQFGHRLEDQIGGQLDAGFVITGHFEDRFAPEARDVLSKFIATFHITRAVKPSRPVL
jgi:SAM-dependent methyltransferase